MNRKRGRSAKARPVPESKLLIAEVITLPIHLRLMILKIRNTLKSLMKRQRTLSERERHFYFLCEYARTKWMENTLHFFMDKDLAGEIDDILAALTYFGMQGRAQMLTAAITMLYGKGGIPKTTKARMAPFDSTAEDRRIIRKMGKTFTSSAEYPSSQEVRFYIAAESIQLDETEAIRQQIRNQDKKDDAMNPDLERDMLAFAKQIWSAGK